MTLQATSLAEQAYQALLQQIISGKRKAGDKLAEEDICAEFGISRTPAREALLLLSRDGLAERLPRRGCCVRKFDHQAVAELFECRRMIEVLALDLGFDSFPREKLKPLLVLLDKDGTAADNKKRSLQADAALHELIAAACPNRHLAEMVRQLQRQTSPFRSYRSLTAADIASITAERRALLQAIDTGDKATSLALLSAHIANGGFIFNAAARD